MASSWDEAEVLLVEAIDTLRTLNGTSDVEDTYPIVTLSEGHISIVRKFRGVEAAQEITQQYANELFVAHKKHPNNRLETAVQKVVTFGTSGVWNKSYGPDIV